MKKNWKIGAITVVFFLGCFLTLSYTAAAESGSNTIEADFNQQTITINLIDDQETTIKGKADTTTEQEATVTKPVGKLPQTGEVRQAGLSVLGIGILVLSLLLGLYQKKRAWGQSDEQ